MANTVPMVQDFDEINRILEAYIGNSKKLALLLDFDGTLAPLVSHPSLSKMDSDSEVALRNIVNNPNVYVAIISGRSADDARKIAKFDDITYAGNHGLEINFKNKARYDHQLDAQTRENFSKMVEELETTCSRNGAWVENKRQSLTFHYRDVPEDQQENLKTSATAIIRKYGFLANLAHAAVEAKPPVVWHKGEAAKYILRTEFGDNWKENVKVIFAGDDTTDEDAMKALKDVGAGLTFRIATSPEIQTNADYRIPSTKYVTAILQWIQQHNFE